MKSGMLIGVLVLATSALSTNAHAELRSRANGAAYYDDVLNVTWLADGDHAVTSGYETNGFMSWYDAQTFIALVNAANHLGVNTWRLPNMDVNGDAYLIHCSGVTEAECRDTELGYMAFVNGVLPYNQGDFGFANITTLYWSSTDYDGTSTEYPNGYPCNSGASGNCAWRQAFPSAPDNYSENHNYVRKTYDGYGVWLVADGDVLGPQQVEVDVNLDRNAQCKGTITVAVLGSPGLDVTQIDQTTLTYEGLSVSDRGNGVPSCKVQDANADGFSDLVCQYANAASEGTLTGELADGTPIVGSAATCVLQ